MNRLTAVLATVSVVLLGGAWLASRALTADVKAPPSTLPDVSPIPMPVPVVVVPPSSNPAPAPAPVPTLPAPTPVVPQPIIPPPPPPAPVVDERTGSEQEIDRIIKEAQAQLDLPEDRSGPATWMRAEKLFERCLAISPDEQRCKLGIEAARRKLGPRPPPPPPGRRPPPPPPPSEE